MFSAWEVMVLCGNKKWSDVFFGVRLRLGPHTFLCLQEISMELFFLILLSLLIASLRKPDKYLDLGGNDITKEMLEQKARDKERLRRLLDRLRIRRKKR